MYIDCLGLECAKTDSGLSFWLKLKYFEKMRTFQEFTLKIGFLCFFDYPFVVKKNFHFSYNALFRIEVSFTTRKNTMYSVNDNPK